MSRNIGPVVLGVLVVMVPAMPAAVLAQPPAEKPEAGAGPPEGPPPPPPELDAFMKPFDGSWRCDTKFAANAFGPGSPELTGKSTVRFRKELEGHFWKGEYDLKKSKTNPAMKGIFYVGYDTVANKFLITGVDSGGGFGTGTGTAEGETVTFLGEQTFAGKKLKVRESLGKTGPKAGFHRIEVDMGAGFVPFVEDTCKK